MTAWDDDWEARRDREEATERVDEWVSEQAHVVHASAGLGGPWGALHPVAWSYCTGRITAGSVPEWRQRYDANPAGVAQSLALCVPALGPQGPQSVHASAGIIAAGGAVSHQPATAASPPRPRGFRNAVDELRSDNAGLIEAASRGGPAPEMFPGSGDQPRATASGIEVSAISGLPWRARLAAAWERDRLAAFRITQDYGDADGDVLSRDELSGHPAVVQYVERVRHWAATSGVGVQPSMTPAEVDGLFPAKKDAA